MTKSLKFILIGLIILFIVIYLLFGIIKIQDIIKKQLYPREYEEIVKKYSEEYNVEDNLIFAIIKAESNFKETSKSSKGAIGLMQLMYETAEEVALSLDMEINEEMLYDPETNIMLGTKYFSNLMNKYNCIPVALAAYNAGSGNVDTWIDGGIIKEDGSDIENIPFKETNNYVRKILRDYEIYKQM